VVLLAVLIFSAGPAMAAWIGGITNSTEIKEPLSKNTITLEEQSVFPGESVTWEVEVKNNANVTYGIKYEAWTFYDFRGMARGSEKSFSRSGGTEPKIEQIRETLTLADISPKGGGAINTNSIGELRLFIDPDGTGPLPESQYVPGTKVDIQPKGIHALKLMLKVAPEAYDGIVVSYIDPFRGAPTATATTQ